MSVVCGRHYGNFDRSGFSAYEEPDDPLIALEYRREVLLYCGGADQQVISGFLSRRHAIIIENAVSENAQQQAQSDARQLAYAEWQNRGLGGFRSWCRNEGQQYIEELKSYGVSD